MEYAARSEADSEFDALIGLTKKETDTAASEGADRTRIPEN